MNSSNKLLSDLVSFRTYAKHLTHQSRRETLEETINRCAIMHLDKFPKLSKDIMKAFRYVHDLKLMPSMRTMQFSGEAIIKNNARGYNCSAAAADNPYVFSEALFLLLSGVGFGFSVQKHHVNQLPKIQAPSEEGYFVVHDSIEGWAQALDLLIQSYFFKRIKPLFDFSMIRPKGSYLVTTGAQAPGPQPLKTMLEEVEKKLKQAVGRKLRPIEVHDIICIISDCVLAGGIRRAALISLFDRDDTEMLTAKSGEWWIKHPYRARANNSAMLPKDEVSEEEFRYIFKMCKDSGSGEPGFRWVNSLESLTNPCSEIMLNSNQFCNLTTVNQTGIKNKKDFLDRIYSATLLGTLQAAYTDFPYLRPSWKETTEREALLGVSFTGVADAAGIVTNEWLQEGAKFALEVNEKYAKKLGINMAARVTTLKPEGSSSCVLGSSSGIHARHSKYYLRRFRITRGDSLDNYLRHVIPELVEDDLFSNTGSVITIPQEAPMGSILRSEENALSLLQRTYDYNMNWIEAGHRYGADKHNVSVTVSVKDAEWEQVCENMWENRDKYRGVSLLPYDGGSYQQAPFEECSAETFNKYSELVRVIDLTQIREEVDNTKRTETVACAGGACEISSI